MSKYISKHTWWWQVRVKGPRNYLLQPARFAAGCIGLSLVVGVRLLSNAGSSRTWMDKGWPHGHRHFLYQCHCLNGKFIKKWDFGGMETNVKVSSLTIKTSKVTFHNSIVALRWSCHPGLLLWRCLQGCFCCPILVLSILHMLKRVNDTVTVYHKNKDQSQN